MEVGFQQLFASTSRITPAQHVKFEKGTYKKLARLLHDWTIELEAYRIQFTIWYK